MAAHELPRKEKILIPFDPFALHQIWFQAWRGHIRNAKENQKERAGYCKAAVVAHAQHQIELALYLVKYRDSFQERS